MSGIISGIDYNLLFSGSSSTSDIASSMLNTLYGGGTNAGSTAVSTGNPLTDLKLAQANETKDVAQEAKTPQVQRDIAAFQAGVAKAKDIQTALANPNVMKVLLTANNLSRYIQYPALAQKALLSDPGQSNSSGQQARRHQPAEHRQDLRLRQEWTGCPAKSAGHRHAHQWLQRGAVAAVAGKGDARPVERAGVPGPGELDQVGRRDPRQLGQSLRSC